MNKALEIYAHILEGHVSSCFANKNNIDPIVLNNERYIVRGLFIAAIIFLKNNIKDEEIKIVSATNSWLKQSFANENLFSNIIDNSRKSLIDFIDEKLIYFKGAESIDIPTLYETLLSVETSNENNGAQTSNAKNYRNKLGGYYTPVNFAKLVTERTIDAFFDLNFGVKKLSVANLNKNDKKILKSLNSISFADFSCGGGIFLTEIICYFEKLFAKSNIETEEKLKYLKSIALNVSAFDVDCQALEVAKLNFLLRIKQPELYTSLSTNFTHANFLLHADSAVDNDNKAHIFSSGYIYHEKLSLNINKLKKYDVILGNPPWEKIRYEEKIFYGLYYKPIADNHFKSSRSIEINKVELNNVKLAEFSRQYKTEIEKAKLSLKQNNFFNLSHNGELNTYALFTDAALKLKSNRGVIGLILKSGIVTSQVNKNIFNHLVRDQKIIAIYDFINRKKIFKIDSRERFCFLLLGNSKSKYFHVSMNLNNTDDINNSKLGIKLSNRDLILLNPISGMLPNFSTKNEADFLLRISEQFTSFNKIFSTVRFGRIVHFTNHAEFISKKSTNDNIPIYEGKFFNQFDGKYSGFNEVTDRIKYSSKASSVVLNESEKKKVDYFPEARFYINNKKWTQLSKSHTEKFMLAWRSLTSATNTRTCISTLLPFIPASQSVQFLTMNQDDLLYLTGLFNSVIFDYILKKKLNGIDLTQAVINQMPVPNVDQISAEIKFNDSVKTIKEHLSLLIFPLFKNDSRLRPLFKDLNLNSPYRSEGGRFETIRNIDLFFMFLYQLNDEELELVLSEFGKQYSRNDFLWFKEKLNQLSFNNPISPSSSFVSSSCPV